MPKTRNKPTPPGRVVLRETSPGRWELIGEAARQPGLTARAARTAAVMDATKGKAKPGQVYAAVLRSEWRLALDWASCCELAERSGRGDRQRPRAHRPRRAGISALLPGAL